MGRSRLISSYALLAFDAKISAREIRVGEARAVAELLPEEAQATRASIVERRAVLETKGCSNKPPEKVGKGARL